MTGKDSKPYIQFDNGYYMRVTNTRDDNDDTRLRFVYGRKDTFRLVLTISNSHKRPAQKKKKTTVLCEKCLEVGHWTHECKKFSASDPENQDLKRKFDDPGEGTSGCSGVRTHLQSDDPPKRRKMSENEDAELSDYSSSTESTNSFDSSAVPSSSSYSTSSCTSSSSDSTDGGFKLMGTLRQLV